MFCIKCGRQVVEEADFCPYCGQKVFSENKGLYKKAENTPVKNPQGPLGPEKERMPFSPSFQSRPLPGKSPVNEKKAKGPKRRMEKRPPLEGRHYGMQVSGFIFALMAFTFSLLIIIFQPIEMQALFFTIPVFALAFVSFLFVLGRRKRTGFAWSARVLSILAMLISLYFILAILAQAGYINNKVITQLLTHPGDFKTE